MIKNEELRGKLQEVINELEESISEEEDCIEIFKNIPEELWHDRYCSLTIIEKIFEYSEYLEEYYAPCELISDYFWDNKDNVFAVIINIGNDLDKFNINEIFPAKCFNDEEILKEIVYYDWDGLYYASEELKGNSSIIFNALSNLEERIEERYDECNYNWHLLSMDKRENLEYFITLISDKLKSNKEFILEFLEHDYFLDEFDLLYDWIDKNLWNDQNFIIKVIKKDLNAIEYISDTLKQNEEFIKKVSEELDQDIKVIRSWL